MCMDSEAWRGDGVGVLWAPCEGQVSVAEMQGSSTADEAETSSHGLNIGRFLKFSGGEKKR